LHDLNNYIIGPDGELMTRPPLLRAGTTIHPAQIYHLNITGGESTSDDWGLLVGDNGSGGSYFRFDDTSINQLTDVDSSATLTPYPNIKSFVYKDIFYVFGDGVSNQFTSIENVVRADVFDEKDFQAAGIDAPVGGPTVAPAAGGSLPDATYKCVVTFYNHRTGAESAPSPLATVTTLAPNSQIAWSAIPVASGAGTGAAQVDYRRLWRTLPNQVNEYYLVGTLIDNTTTVFADNVAVESMGSRVSLQSRAAFACLGSGTMWRERMWSPGVLASSSIGKDQTAMVYSQIGLIEDFMSDGFIVVGANDVSPLVTSEACDDFLLVFKKLSVWRVSGTGPSNFRIDRLRSPAGIADTYAVASGPPGTFFLGSDGYFYFTDGGSVTNISQQLGKLDLHVGLGSTDGPVATQVQSVLWPSRNWFMTVVYAQAPACSGTVHGIIGDGTGPASGAVGANGWAVLCSDDDEVKYEVQANGSGVWSIPNVACGTYNLIIRDDAGTAYRLANSAAVVTNGVNTDTGTRTLNTAGVAPTCPGGAAPTAAGSISTIYVYDYVKHAWSYWNFDQTTPTKPRPRCLIIGYNSVGLSSRLYAGGQTDDAAFVNYFDDDLFLSANNATDIATEVGGDLTDTYVAPARSIRTKDFDAKDFGGVAGDGFIITQVLVRIAWPTSIEDSNSPDSNWPLNLEFNLYGNVNLNTTVPALIAGPSSIAWSTEDRANDQWHAVGLSSQQQSVTSIGLEIVSAEGDAPRRHSITGIAFEVVFTNRNYIQAGQSLTSNITSTISGTVTGGAGGTVYLCPADPDVPSTSTVADGSGNYSFSGLVAGTYTIIGTNSGNTSSGVHIIEVELGVNVVENFILDIPSGSTGCPVA